MGARSRGRAATPRRRHGAASGGGQGLGGREPDVLDHDDAIDPSEACEKLGIELTSLDEMLRRCAVHETGR